MSSKTFFILYMWPRPKTFFSAKINHVYRLDCLWNADFTSCLFYYRKWKFSLWLFRCFFDDKCIVVCRDSAVSS